MKEKLQTAQKVKDRVKLSLQEQLLQEAVQSRQNITLILLKGLHVNGTIREYDKFSILIEFEGTQQLVYKHAISTIRF
ncbi:RNA chaperone Hfq [Bacillus cereus]|uniref:RNA chaperone Hfq n=1 Tax=Bacillus cereus TaxID=1396 RepID=UPI0039807D3D